MYSVLLNFHSIFRYVVLILVAAAIIVAVAALFGKKDYSDGNRKLNLFAMISMHTQLLLGLILYFFSPNVQLSNIGAAMKETVLRYWTVEHGVMMLFAVALVTIGHSKAKKGALAINRHRSVALYYGLALLVVLLAIYQSGRPILGLSS